MQKNSITNKITPCCGLPFSVIYWWVSNLTLNSENDRQFILSKISQNGTISIDGWKVLVNSGTLEADASLTKSEFLEWFDCGRQPNCEKLKIIIEGFKISNFNPNENFGLGWTEIFEYEIFEDKTIKKITGYVGGLGDLPTELSERIGLFYTDNGLTNDKNDALDFNSVGKYLPILGNANDNVNASIAQGGAVYLLPIVYETNLILSVPNDTMFVGVKGKTVIKYTGSGTLISLINSKNIKFQDVIFDGGNTVDFNALMTVNDVKNLVGKGTQNCINITGTAENISFIDCIFKGFSGWGVFINQPLSYKMQNNISFRGTKFIGNYLGLVRYERAEYNFDSQIECVNNKVGIWIDGGNNFISTANITQNSVGVVITGETNNNDTHGGFSNCAINHNKSFNIFAFKVNNGFTFNGCHFFEGKIRLEDSIGVNIQGGIIDSLIEEASPRTNSKNLIANNMFFNSYGTNNASLFTKIVMRDNLYANGNDSTALNNNI